ncbi:hypothetical protein HG531_014072 [Fusarium graminearum]|nr:hypothetical protein HG531_014072 [Fusarium graminearum]
MTIQGPYANSAIIATRGYKFTVRAECHRTNPPIVPAEDRLVKGREWLEVLRAGELWQKRVRIDIEPVLPNSWCKIEIQAAIETLLDELAVTRNLAQRVELGCTTPPSLRPLFGAPPGIRVEGKPYGIRIISLIRDLVHLQSLEKLELILGKVKRLSSFRICQASPALGDLNAVEEGI